MKALLLIIIITISFKMFATNISIGPSFYTIEMNLVIDSDQSFEPNWKHQIYLSETTPPKLLLAITLPKSYQIEGFKQDQKSIYNYYIPLKEGINNHLIKIENQNQDTISKGSLSIKLTPSKNLSLMSQTCEDDIDLIKKQIQASWIYTYCRKQSFQQYNMLNTAQNKSYSLEKNRVKKQDKLKYVSKTSSSSGRIKLGYSHYQVNQQPNKDYFNLGFSKQSQFGFLETALEASLDFIGLKGNTFNEFAFNTNARLSIKNYQYGSDYFHFKPYLHFDYSYHDQVAFQDKGFLYTYLGIQLKISSYMSMYYSTSLYTTLESNSSSQYGFIYSHNEYQFFIEIKSINAPANQQSIEFDRYQLGISKRI